MPLHDGSEIPRLPSKGEVADFAGPGRRSVGDVFARQSAIVRIMFIAAWRNGCPVDIRVSVAVND